MTRNYSLIDNGNNMLSVGVGGKGDDRRTDKGFEKPVWAGNLGLLQENASWPGEGTGQGREQGRELAICTTEIAEKPARYKK